MVEPKRRRKINLAGETGERHYSLKGIIVRPLVFFALACYSFGVAYNRADVDSKYESELSFLMGVEVLF